VNPIISRIDNLDELPIIRHSCAQQYLTIGKLKEVQMLSGRGCYGNCTFCTSPQMDGLYGSRKIRFRSIENIIEEIKFVNSELLVNHIDFVDDVFLIPGIKGLERAQEFSKAIESENIDITFNIMLRADSINIEAIKILMGVGLNEVFIGIESFDPSTLAIYDKKCSIEQYHDALEKLIAIGFSTHFLSDLKIKMGLLPFHAHTSFESLLNELNATRKWGVPPKRLRGRVVPFSGTRIYEKYKSANLLIDDDVSVPRFKFIDSRIEQLYYVWRNHIDYICSFREPLKRSCLDKRIFNIDMRQIIDRMDSFATHMFEDIVSRFQSFLLDDSACQDYIARLNAKFDSEFHNYAGG
jgi:radical SAM superfamily enzyme YgiQ (UPF0313 family)